VIDHLVGKQPHHYDLHWLLCDSPYEVRDLGAAHFGIWLEPSDSLLFDSKISIQLGLLEGNANFSLVRADPHSSRGWRSRYYADKEPALSALLETNRPRACFWTFFGLEGDVVQIEGETFKLFSPKLPSSINHQLLIPIYQVLLRFPKAIRNQDF
jgi:hypothetical protein